MRASKIVVPMTVGALVIGGATAVFGFADYPVDSLAPEQVTGRWVSTTREAPGELTIALDGSAYSTNLTILDPHYSNPPIVVAQGLTAEGGWVIGGDNVSVVLEDDGRRIQFPLLARSSPFQGLTLRTYVGDPDGPVQERVFVRED
ncbi:hypothetical protein GCM10009775_05690 [Microbacterium aoyamense]|uniref:Uncharacterized protein n=1 Tax=Microbacterium aoyamense TaxID=344166 RepID=A0ABN2PAG9_9MICO